MVVLSKIYTRTGDDGTTALGSGRRVAKYDLRVEAYGTLDETNAAIGLARLHTRGTASSARCHARAHPERSVRSRRRPLLSRRDQGRARPPVGERRAGGAAGGRDRRRSTASFSRSRSFVLPGGSPAASYLHLARTVSRRAERLMVALAARPGEPVGDAAASLHQPAIGFPVRRGTLRQRQRQGRRDCGCRARTGNEGKARVSVFIPLHDTNPLKSIRLSNM